MQIPWLYRTTIRDPAPALGCGDDYPEVANYFAPTLPDLMQQIRVRHTTINPHTAVMATFPGGQVCRVPLWMYALPVPDPPYSGPFSSGSGAAHRLIDPQIIPTHYTASVLGISSTQIHATTLLLQEPCRRARMAGWDGRCQLSNTEPLCAPCSMRRAVLAFHEISDVASGPDDPP